MKIHLSHLRVEDESAVLVPVVFEFTRMLAHERIAILDELIALVSRERLQGHVVPVWANTDGTLGFLAEPRLHRALRSVSLGRLRANINRSVQAPRPSSLLTSVVRDPPELPLPRVPRPPRAPRALAEGRSGAAMPPSMASSSFDDQPPEEEEPSWPPAPPAPAVSSSSSSLPPSHAMTAAGLPGALLPSTPTPAGGIARAYTPMPVALPRTASLPGFDIARFNEPRRTSRELPMQLVTMLFSDIVGSTELKQRVGEHRAMELLQWHHDVVRDVLATSLTGEEVSTAGDSFFVVFASPSDAVRCALQLQARLRTGPGQGFVIHDRIGIHVGEVFLSNEAVAGKVRDFYGMQVDTCARVMSLGGADQILMTRFAHDNARHSLRGADLPGLNPLQWTCHGYYQVKGVDEPIEVFEVGERGLAPMRVPSPDKRLRIERG